jgi:hypothetical protein
MGRKGEILLVTSELTIVILPNEANLPFSLSPRLLFLLLNLRLVNTISRSLYYEMTSLLV